jgi:hypothetical protein
MLRPGSSFSMLAILFACGSIVLSPVDTLAGGSSMSQPDAEDSAVGGLGLQSEEPPAPANFAPTGPVVHIVNEKPDDTRGAIKLAKYRGTTTAAGGNVVVITTLYDEICTEPCREPIDTTDNPVFFFVRDGNSVSYPFRLQRDGEVTLSLKPFRRGLSVGGMYLTAVLILPAGIPMMIAGRAKVSLAEGAPSEGQVFVKVKKAKL